MCYSFVTQKKVEKKVYVFCVCVKEEIRKNKKNNKSYKAKKENEN